MSERVSVASGSGQPSAEPAVTDVERRVWVRYPCDISTVCRSIEETAELRLSARVLEISRGGVTLLSCRPFEAGTLLSVELPGVRASDSCTVLAYVLRVEPQEDGECVVGCQFATELTGEDLEPFTNKRVKPSPPDSRDWVRFPWRARVTYRSVEPTGLDDEAAEAIDLSPKGIGLIMQQPPDVGILLQLDLRSSSGEPILSILASVVRVATRGSNACAVGCNFIRELTEEELRSLG